MKVEVKDVIEPQDNPKEFGSSVIKCNDSVHSSQARQSYLSYYAARDTYSRDSAIKPLNSVQQRLLALEQCGDYHPNIRDGGLVSSVEEEAVFEIERMPKKSRE